MSDTGPARILVGVESTDCEAPLQYAAAEAVRHECGIHLVHVAHPAMLEACALDDLALLEDQVRSASNAALAHAARRLDDILGDAPISVSTELTHGSTIPALVSLSGQGAVVVLQHQGTGSAGETASPAVTESVCGGAQCPVVAVPPQWRAAPEHGRVLVGVGDRTLSREIVRVAIDEAARRTARLLMVHAWTPDRGSSTQAVEAESDRRHDELSGLLGDLLVTEPDHRGDHVVRVERVVRSGPPAAILLEASHDVDLIIVGRHDYGHGVEASVGTTARELLCRSTIPVMVVDPAPKVPFPAPSNLATLAMP